jgi:hypothetical protein
LLKALGGTIIGNLLGKYNSNDLLFLLSSASFKIGDIINVLCFSTLLTVMALFVNKSKAINQPTSKNPKFNLIFISLFTSSTRSLLFFFQREKVCSLFSLSLYKTKRYWFIISVPVSI